MSDDSTKQPECVFLNKDSPHKLVLHDDQICRSRSGTTEAMEIAQLIDQLRGDTSKSTTISLRPVQGRPRDNSVSMVTYRVLDYESFYRRKVPAKLEIEVSHFVGSYRTTVGERATPVVLQIVPRFGHAVFNYLLSFVSHVFVPENADSQAPKVSEDYVDWLMTLLWRSAFNKAVSVGHIPRSYVELRENLRTVRGRIMFAAHLRKNIIDQSRIYCRYRKLTFDNTLNRTVRYVYRLLSHVGDGNLLSEVGPYSAMLGSMGVSDGPVDADRIRKIVYTPMNVSYKLLMDLSARIIEAKGGGDGASRGVDGVSFFLDVAELWENYVYRVLTRGLRDDYEIVSPNFEGETHYLLKDRMRSYRPDILVKMKKDGRIIAIIDAKYKSNYSEIGEIEKKPGAVSRDDLYQMTTYLWNLQKDKQPIIGLFVSPREEAHNGDSCPAQCVDVPLHAFEADSNIKIGVVNLCLPGKDESVKPVKPAELRERAEKYASSFTCQIKRLLDKASS